MAKRQGLFWYKNLTFKCGQTPRVTTQRPPGDLIVLGLPVEAISLGPCPHKIAAIPGKARSLGGTQR